MTKTLTEQYYDQILEDGFYYAKPNDDKNTFILGVHPWEIGQYQNCEVLAPVPSYEEWKRLQERNEKLEKMTFHYTPGEWNTMMRMASIISI